MKVRYLITSVLIAVCMIFAVACGDTETDNKGLGTPEPTISGTTLSWKAVSGAEKYTVTVNGSQYNTKETTFTITVSDPGQYDIYVTAVKGDEKRTSKKLTYTYTATLGTPAISLSGNVVSWTAIPNATGYEVYVNDALKTTVTAAKYTITEEEVGTYIIKVKATGGAGYNASELSTAVTYKVEQGDIQLEKLDAPEISLTKRTVSWTAVQNATSYKVLVDGVEAATVTDGTSYDLKLRTEGEYQITVTAQAPSSDYLASDASNAETFTVAAFDIEKPVVAYIVGNGATAEYSAAQGKLVQSGEYDDSGLDDAFITRAWRLIKAGDYYKIKLDNGAYLTSKSGGSYAWYEAESDGDGQLWEFRKGDNGTYTIINKAVGEYLFCANTDNGSFHFYNDVQATSQCWQMFNVDVEFGADMEVLTAPTLDINDKVVTWTEVEHATAYKVYVNGVYKQTVTEREYEVEPTTEGLYTVTVIASGEGYLDSVASVGANYMYSTLDLAQPIYATYAASNGTVYAAGCDDEGYVILQDVSEITDFTSYMWYLESDGEYYKIKYANGYYLTRVSNGNGPEGKLMPANNGDSQLWKLVADGFNKYKLQNKEHISAYGNGYFYGEWFNVFKFADACFGWNFANKDIAFGSITKLDAPTIVLNDSGVASWGAVDGATGYDIYINGAKTDTVTEPTYTLSDGEMLYVRAVSTNANTEASYNSNTVNFVDLCAQSIFATYTANNGTVYAAGCDDEGYVILQNANEITDFTSYMWYLERDGEYYKIKYANGYYLTRVANGDNGPEGKLMPANGGDEQKWKLTPDGINSYKLSNVSHANQWAGGNLNSYFYGEYDGVLKFNDSVHGWSFTNKNIPFGNITKLAAPTVELNDGVASWTAVDNATEYEIYINGVKTATVTALTYTMQNSGDALRVKAVADGYESSYLSNSVTYTNLFASPVVAYYTQNNGAKTLGVISNDDNTLRIGAEYTTVSDYSDYLWTFEKLANGNYMIKLADGRYLSYYDNPNSGEVPQTIAAEKDVNDEKQQWILVADGDSGTKFRLENVHLSHYYQNVYLGEWWGSYKFAGACNAWTFFNPNDN